MTVREMRESILNRRPNFKKVIDTWGEKTLLEYFTQNFENLSEPSEDFLRALFIETELLFGDKIATQTVEAMREKKWVNTADHHGLLCHPYFYAASLARSHKDVRGSNQVTLTLPFSSISLSNDSFPRGFFFHNAEGILEKIFFKSLKDRRLPVYALPAMKRAEFEHAVRHVQTIPLGPDAKKRLMSFIDSFRTSDSLWKQTTYGAQLTLMNAVLWNNLFGANRGSFVYLPIENIVVRLLLEKHLVTETPIYNVLFDESWREEYLQELYGAEHEHRGTEFFWYIDYARMTSRPLVVQGNTLTTKEGDVTLALTPESIAEALRAKALMPSTALMMVLLQGAEGVACGGGPNQLEYLETYTTVWSALTKKHKREIHIPNTQILSEATPLFHIKNDRGHVEPASLIDVFLYGKNEYSETVDITLKKTTILNAFDTLAPTYHYMYSKKKIPIIEMVQTSFLDCST